MSSTSGPPFLDWFAALGGFEGNPLALEALGRGEMPDVGADVENPRGAPDLLRRLWTFREGCGFFPGVFCLRFVGTITPGQNRFISQKSRLY